MIDATTFGEELAGIVKSATAPLIAENRALHDRLDALEKRLADMPVPQDGAPGDPGKDADPEAVAALVLAQIGDQLAALQEAVKGLLESGPVTHELPDIPAMVEASVAEAVSLLPKPQNGVDGKPGEKGEPGRDGLDVKDLFRADGGRLVAVMSDGSTKDLGEFVGKDGADGRDGAPGRDGADGLGFEDLSFEYDEYGRPLAKFQRGDVVKSVRLPGIVDRGVFSASQTYLKGDAVSYGGSLWIAQDDVAEGRPDTGKGWRLAVKKGRDARDTSAKKVI